MIALDIDGDGDKDLMNGDILGNNMLLVVNGGSTSGATMIAQDDSFPSYDDPVDLVTFPGPYYFDANNDGIYNYLNIHIITATYNQGLSERRANAVRDVLVNQYGVGADRVNAVGYGESRPVADNATADGRAVNRRVEAEVEARP